MPLAVGVRRADASARSTSAPARSMSPLVVPLRPSMKTSWRDDLRVVARSSCGSRRPRSAACRFLPVRLLRQVAAEAARHPRGVAGVAGHLVAVRRAALVVGHRAPGLAVAWHRLGERRLRVVVRRCSGRCVSLHLRDLPLEVLASASSAGSACRRPTRSGVRPKGVDAGEQVVAARRRRRARWCAAWRARADGAVAVQALDLDRVRVSP